jgi:hypothetical protein
MLLASGSPVWVSFSMRLLTTQGENSNPFILSEKVRGILGHNGENRHLGDAQC